MFRLVHKSCGGMAFRYRDEPVAGQPLDRTKMVYLDGRDATRMVGLTCGNCGKPLDSGDLHRSNFRLEKPEPKQGFVRLK